VTALLGDPSLNAASSNVKLGLVNFNSAGSRVTRSLTPFANTKNTFFNVVPDTSLPTVSVCVCVCVCERVRALVCV
jgi:hypothetical protein